jgi:hypothetical protein
MRLLRLSEVEIGLNDRVFRHARLRALLLWLAAFCGDAVMFFSAVTGRHLHCAETVRLQHAAGEDDGGWTNQRAAAHVTLGSKEGTRCRRANGPTTRPNLKDSGL